MDDFMSPLAEAIIYLLVFIMLVRFIYIILIGEDA